jgi:hypothetical protein
MRCHRGDIRKLLLLSLLRFGKFIVKTRRRKLESDDYFFIIILFFFIIIIIKINNK